MKQRRIFLMALAAALTPLEGWPANDPAPDAASNAAPPPFVVPADVKLSRPARDVVKMTASGVPEDVIKAYVESSPTAFNLSADNIIHMQGVGVSGGVTSEMLAHDKKLSDQTAMTPPPMAPAQAPPAPYPYPYPYPPAGTETAPPEQPVNSVSTYTIPSDSYPYYYSNLAPYGSWSFLTGYGWCWQPYYGLAYAYYPWGCLRYGSWWNCPGRGWVWCPRNGYYGTAGYHGGSRGYYSTGHYGGNTFAANRSAGGFTGGGTVSVHTIGSSSHVVSSHSMGSAHFSAGGHAIGGGHSVGAASGHR